MNESAIQREIKLALGCEPDVLLFRNNVGQAKYYDDKTGREMRVVYGLAPGSADLVGLLTRAGIGVFFALEVKQPGKYPTSAQRAWREAVLRMGGFHAVVRSVGEAWAALYRAREGARE